MARNARSKVKVKVKVEVEVKDRLVSPKRSNRDPAPSTPQHAAHRYHTVLMIVGAVMLSLCGLLVLGIQSNPKLYEIVVAVLSFLFGGALLSLGWRGRQLGNGVQTVNISFDSIARGHLVEAEKRLDSIDVATASPLIACVVAIQRGFIAMQRGDAKTGLNHLEQAITIKPGLLHRGSVRIQTVNALGIRAFLRSVTGDHEGARVDAKALRESPDALPQALARAALAEAICLEKEGDRDALRRHLQTHHDLLFNVTDRRERAIVRAFQRMLETTATSVYRKGTKLDMHGDEPPLVDWVAQLVPSAAPFVATKSTTNVTNELPPAIASADGKKAVSEARKTAEKQVPSQWSPFRRILLMWGGLVGVAFTLIQLTGPRDASDGGGGGSRTNDDVLTGAGVAFGIFMAALIGKRIREAVRANRDGQKLFAAINLSARGEVEAAKEQLEVLTRNPAAFIKAHAHLALAQIAEYQADLPKALEHCDQGIASLSRYVLRISASDILLPDLMSQRAFVLAAMDRYEEAEAELEALPQAYPYRSRALLRVRLVTLVRRGDLDGAARLAAETSLDLPLTARDELLADGVRVATHPDSLGAGELPRIRRELRTMTSLRSWLATVAPGALAAIERAPEDSLATVADERDQAAEEEARAEDEAAREEVALRRAESMS